jgi:hypothetical protein
MAPVVTQPELASAGMEVGTPIDEPESCPTLVGAEGYCERERGGAGAIPGFAPAHFVFRSG